MNEVDSIERLTASHPKIVLGAHHLARVAAAKTSQAHPLTMEVSGFERGGVLVLDSYQRYRDSILEYLSFANFESLLIVVTQAEELQWAVADSRSQKIFDHPSVRWACLPLNERVNPQEYFNIWRQLTPTLSLRLLQDPERSASPALLALFKDLENLQRFVVLEMTTLAGSVADEVQGLENCLKNLPRFLQTPDFRNWPGQLRNVPAFILGAGPSLDSQIEFVRKYQNRAFVIAADTLYKKLNQEKIKVDVYVSIERVGLVTELLKTPATGSSIFCSTPVVPPECFEFSPESKAMFFLPSAMNSFFRFKRVVMDSGHSCIGGAIALVKNLKCGPVFMMGIDLCFGKNMESHSKLAPYNDALFSEYQDFFENWRKEAIPLVNRKGERVFTHIYWLKFKEEFERLILGSESPFFCLSEEGLEIRNVKPVDFASAEKMIAEVKPVDAYNTLQRLLPYDRHREATEELKSFIDKLKLIDKIWRENEKIFSLNKPQAFEKLVRALPLSDEIFYPIFRVGLNRIASGAKDFVEVEKQAISSGWSRIHEIVMEALPNLESLLASAESKRTKLY